MLLPWLRFCYASDKGRGSRGGPGHPAFGEEAREPPGRLCCSAQVLSREQIIINCRGLTRRGSARVSNTNNLYPFKSKCATTKAAASNSLGLCPLPPGKEAPLSAGCVNRQKAGVLPHLWPPDPVWPSGHTCGPQTQPGSDTPVERALSPGTQGNKARERERQ